MNSVCELPQSTTVNIGDLIIKDVEALKKPCQRVDYTKDGKRVAEKLINVAKMWNEANPSNIALGLAAPQIGIDKQVFIVYNKRGYFTFINPRYTFLSGTFFESPESCLSLPDVTISVPRHSEIHIQSTEWKTPIIFGVPEKCKTPTHDNLRMAATIQHEFDHVMGVLINSTHEERAAKLPWYKGEMNGR